MPNSLEIHFSLYLCNHYIMQASFKQAKYITLTKTVDMFKDFFYIYQHYIKKLSTQKYTATN